MKKINLILICLFCSFVIPNARANNIPIDYAQHSHSGKMILKVSYSYEIVFKDGTWWIYEYNEDGRLVNIYPTDE